MGPTPTQMTKQEISRQIQDDGNAVLMNLQTQGMITDSSPRPPVPMTAPPKSPPSIPPPNVIVSPCYDKSIGHGVHSHFDHGFASTAVKMEKKKSVVAELTNDILLGASDEYGI